MRITAPETGYTFDAKLEEDEYTMLWLNEPNGRGQRMGRYLLSAVLIVGWRIIGASPDERAVLEAHGFGSGRIQ